MRLHAHKGNNRTKAKCRTVTVLLNGQDVTNGCIACDTRQGWVEEYARLAPPLSGFYVGKDGNLARQRRHGKVRVEFV